MTRPTGQALHPSSTAARFLQVLRSFLFWLVCLATATALYAAGLFVVGSAKPFADRSLLFLASLVTRVAAFQVGAAAVYLLGFLVAMVARQKLSIIALLVTILDAAIGLSLVFFFSGLQHVLEGVESAI